MKISVRNVAKILLWTGISWVWLQGTMIVFALYLALSTALNGGHPWPYNALLIVGVIPLVIAGALGAGILLFARMFIDLRTLFRCREFYMGIGITLVICAAMIAAAVLIS